MSDILTVVSSHCGNVNVITSNVTYARIVRNSILQQREATNVVSQLETTTSRFWPIRCTRHGKHDHLWRTGECHAAFPLIATVTISSYDARIHKAEAELSAEKKLNIRKKTKSRAIQRDRGRNRGKKKLVIQNFASDCFSWLCQKSGGELPIFYSELYIRYNSAQCQCSVRKFLAPTRSLRNANVGLCVRPSVRPVQTCLVWAENTSSCSCKMPNVCHM